MTNYHVVPRQDEEWAVHEEGVISSDEARYEAKEEAIAHAEELARNAAGILYIQNRMGEIDEKRDFSE